MLADFWFSFSGDIYSLGWYKGLFLGGMHSKKIKKMFTKKVKFQLGQHADKVLKKSKKVEI